MKQQLVNMIRNFFSALRTNDDFDFTDAEEHTVKLHHFHDNNRIGLTMAVIKVERNGLVRHAVGYALCSRHDSGSRATGAYIATERAWKAVERFMNTPEQFVDDFRHTGWGVLAQDSLKSDILNLREVEAYGSNRQLQKQYRNAFNGFKIEVL